MRDGLRTQWTALAAVFAACMLGACTQSFISDEERDSPLPPEKIYKVGDYFQVVGKAKKNPKLETETQRISEARDAALRDARSRLKRLLESLRTPKGTLGELTDHQPDLRQFLADIVDSSEPVSTHFDKSGLATVTVRVKKEVINKAFGTDFR